MPLIDNKTQVKVRYYLPDNAVLTELSDLFSVLSDSTRIKILSAICISEMCVGDLSEMLDMNQTTVSHQLKILRSTGVVTARRDGKTIYYSLANMIFPKLCVSERSILGIIKSMPTDNNMNVGIKPPRKPAR